MYDGVSTDIEWHVDAVSLGWDGPVVWSRDGSLDLISRHRIVPMSSDASSPPGKYGAWIDAGREIVNPGKERQALPDGCCANARVVGMDVDMNQDIFIRADDGAWMWDTYEGAEGMEPAPPETEEHFWPIDLGRGELAGVGTASEVLVRYPGHQWGWGFVGGPRDPASDASIAYQEQERVAADQVWLTSRAIVALVEDELVILGSEHRHDQGGHSWRTLDGTKRALNLPAGLRVGGVLDEDGTLLIDLTEDGQRAWVRCTVRTLACEIATLLPPNAIVPRG